MKITYSTSSITSVNAEVLAIGVRNTKSDAHIKSLNAAMGGNSLTKCIKDEGFKAKRGQILKVPGRGRVKANWVVLVGLSGDSMPDSDDMLVAHRLMGAIKQQKTAAMLLSESSYVAAREATEGLVGGGYKYTQYKTKKPTAGIRSITLLGDDKAAANDAKEGITDGSAVAECINVARDLVNEPPNDLNPVTLAEFAKAACREFGVTCEVWNKARIEKERMNLFLAVNRGSAIEPRLIHMKYRPSNPEAKVVFVGKGLTFDAGGLCLKPAGSMLGMKCDMAGAATTVGVVLAAARLGLPIEVHGIIGSTENMTGAAAYRPGDVFTSREGKTVEIINTDAEGRLVLADVLSYAKELEPDWMIDHATLTGASMVALGPNTAALFSEDEELRIRYQTAATESNESVWHMPLNQELRSMLDSSIADIKHTGTSQGGAITAALFLKEFVGKTRWAHMDIAGPSFLDKPRGRHPKGGTGFGVATGIAFLEGLLEDLEV